MKGSKLRILNHFKKNGSITSMEAFQNYGITRLSARIKDLRDMGYDIVTHMVESPNRYGEITRYAKYVLRGERSGNESISN